MDCRPPKPMPETGRPLQLRKRPDLIVQPQNYLGRCYWVVKDPLALKYYRFEDEEFALLEMLDGRASLDELQYRFEQRFAPQKIPRQELHRLVGLLHRHALVVSDAAGQGEQLRRRNRQRGRQATRAALANLLSLRVRLWDPDLFLGWLNRYAGWLFSPLCVAACLLLIAAALLLVVVQLDAFRGRLPGFQAFFASSNWIWLAVALAVTKVLHELGHGLACKRFGGECHEMGFLLLVLTPCLYCNVSDSWMLPSKWQRAAIGAAGMYVELVVAALCTLVWWSTQPGLLHYLCLNVMFVCSVSTLLFNANPLLRYDGYYILSDLIEIPNLRQKAAAILGRRAAAWCLGLKAAADPFLPQRRQSLFALYAIASAVYRWVTALGILWFLNLVFRPYGFQVLGQLLAVVAAYGLVVQPLWQVVSFLRVPGRIDRVDKKRLLMTLSAATVCAAAVFLIPLPKYVSCSLYLEPRDAAAVYVECPGQLSAIHVRPGDWVRAGQPLVALDSVDIRLAVARLQGERKQLLSKLASVRHRAFEDEVAAAQIEEVEESLISVDEQLQKRQRESNHLLITSPVSGVVIPPPRRDRDSEDSGLLPFWSGSPLEERNLRAFLDEGVAICSVGDPNRYNAILAIDQSDLEFVHAGQPIDIVVEQRPGFRYRSRLEQLSRLDMKASPRGLASSRGGDLLTRRTADGGERPLSTTYQGSAPLLDDEGLLFNGATGRGRIHAGSQTIARRLWRYVCQTFRLQA